MPAVAADHDQIHRLGLGDAMDLALGSSEDEVSPAVGHIEVLGEVREVRACLLVDLVLHR